MKRNIIHFKGKYTECYSTPCGISRDISSLKETSDPKMVTCVYCAFWLRDVAKFDKGTRP